MGSSRRGFCCWSFFTDPVLNGFHVQGLPVRSDIIFYKDTMGKQNQKNWQIERRGTKSLKPMIKELPLTIDEAVSMLLDDLPLLDRTRLGAMTSEELNLINEAVGLQIASEFRLWGGNDALLNACLTAVDKSEEGDADPTMVIVRAMWKKLQETHVLRLVK